MGHCDPGQSRQRRETEAACVQSAARRAALADTATQVRRPGPLPGGCPACREMVALVRRQNRLLEELLTAMGVRPE